MSAATDARAGCGEIGVFGERCKGPLLLTSRVLLRMDVNGILVQLEIRLGNHFEMIGSKNDLGSCCPMAWSARCRWVSLMERSADPVMRASLRSMTSGSTFTGSPCISACRTICAGFTSALLRRTMTYHAYLGSPIYEECLAVIDVLGREPMTTPYGKGPKNQIG